MRVDDVSDDAKYIFVGGLDEGERYQVDKDDFCTMDEVMKAWPPLRLRNDNIKITRGRRRFNTAFDALKEFLRVDEENGSYKIVKVDLSQLTQELRSRHNDSFRTVNIRSVPAAFGKLAHLQELDLRETDISKLPTEILLGCKHLKVLNLSNTRNLSRLPDEIGNLLELQELYLHNSFIRSLPRHSVLGKLQKLQVLDLSATQFLEKLENNHAAAIDDDGFTPIHHRDAHVRKLQSEDLDNIAGGREEELEQQMDAVDDRGETLMNLRKLNLRHSAILKGSPSFPPLWKNDLLRRLFMSSNRFRDLDLSGAKGLTSLQDVIRNTNRLERLNLSFTDISKLPPSTSNFYDKLVHLKVLSLTSTPVLRKYPQQMKKMMGYNNTGAAECPPLRNLVLGRHSLLGCIGLRPYQTDGFIHHRKLSHALALNRARSRIISAWKAQTHHEKEGGGHRHMWPILLAKRAVDLYRPYEECNDKNCDCQRLPEEPDALFGLLMTFCNEIFGHSRTLPVNTDEPSIDNDSFVVVGHANGANDGEDAWTLLQ